MQTTRSDQARATITGVVVAGGKSMRLGQDKRRLRFWGADGPTLLEHTVQVMAARCRDVVAVLNDPEAWPGLACRTVPDIFPAGGALGGIYSGLEAASTHYAFAVAADMPLLDTHLIAWMIDQPRDYDVLAPRLDTARARNRLGVESLHAIYSKSCLEPIRGQLEAGNPQVIGFFPRVRVRIVEPEIIARFDPAGVAFRNVNTPEELEEVRELLVKRET